MMMSDKCLRWFTIVLSSAAVIISMSCLVVSIYLGNLSGQSNTKTNNSETSVCVDTKMLLQEIEEDDPLIKKLVKRSKDGQEKYCADTSEQWSALIELMMKAPEVEHAPLPTFEPSDFAFAQVSAQKRLHPSKIFQDNIPQFDENDNCLLLLDPHKNDPLTEHVRGVEVLSTGLHILQSGWYYVYSNIHFRPDSNRPCKDYKYQTWESVVMRSRPNDRQNSGRLLKSLHTCCDSCTKDEETRHEAGVFYLQAGDLLYVEVSGSGLVSFQKQSSFFGLFMQGNAGVPLHGQIFPVEKGPVVLK